MKNIKFKIIQLLILSILSLNYSINLYANEINNSSINKNIEIKDKTYNKQIEVRKNKRLKEINNIKRNFEIRKQEIILKIKSWEINKYDARKLIINERNKIIQSAKTKIKDENKIRQSEKREKIKTLMKNKLDKKLNNISSLSNEKKELIYTKLIEKLETKLTLKNISKRNILLINILIEVLKEEKNILN